MESMMYCGYEVNPKICKGTKRVLRRLKKNGIVVLATDDGLGQLIKAEVIKIAEELSLDHFQVSPWEHIVIDREFYQRNSLDLSDLPINEYPKY